MRNVATALTLTGLMLAACSTPQERDEQSPTDRVGTNGPDSATTDVDADSTATQDGLDEAWQALTLSQQKRRFLVESHLEQARQLQAEVRLEDALLETARALELAPDDQAAQELNAEIAYALGDRTGETRTLGEILGSEYEIRAEQAYQNARSNYERARTLLARGNYDQAIVELGLAQDQIRWMPYSVDWRGLDAEVPALLNEARAQREVAQEAARRDEERTALSALREQEQSARERQRAVVANMLDEAITAFRLQEYDAAMRYADRVLKEDPNNERARDLRDTAFRAGRNKVREEYLSEKRDAYRTWQEEMYELRIPYVDVVTLPDEDEWKAKTDLRARRRGLDLSQTISPSERELREALASTRIPGYTISDEESLTTVIGGLRAITGLPLVVDPAAEEAAIDEGVVFDFDFKNPLKAEQALNIFTAAAGNNVTWTIRHDAIIVTTREKARGELLIYNHDVQDLIFGLTDFYGPRIDRLRLIDELEDDDGGGPFGGIGERPTINEPDELLTLVTENVEVGSWEEEGVAITIEAGNMVIVHSAAVHAQVKQFLEDLRRFSSSLVTIESKFLVMGDNYLQEIGVDWRGIDNPGTPFTDLDDVAFGGDDQAGAGLDNSGSGTGNAPGAPSSGFFYDDGEDGAFLGRAENLFGNALGGALTSIGGLTAQWDFLDDLQISMILRLVEKEENVELINNQMLSVQNTQRAYVTVINQRAYVQDFDVEVAQFQAVADPVINVLTEGIVMDVRPTIHHDRQKLTLEVQPTVAKVVSLTNFSTALSGDTAPVTFQLPELEVQSVFTTAVVPDGGTILVGGLSRIRNIERRAEVPWLANLPLVGFFFKEEGYNDEKESLTIMIKAWITDVKESLADLER
ncbi:MAG: hypothetical protein WD226_11195 [Planctomycetota bacterium]